METSNKTGLQRYTLTGLIPDTSNALIVGIIIAKFRPRKLNDDKNAGSERAVTNFTIRDSLYDYINVICWGISTDIFHIHDKFHIGDVVELIRPKIEIRKINDHGEQFRPMVTSPYSLILNEVKNQVVHHEGPVDAYVKLLHLPTKPIAGFVTIAELHSRASEIQGLVDVLGAVRSVTQIRNITIKDGTPKQVRSIMILDHSNPGLKITIWDPDLINRADSWKPRETVLFFTDMKVEWSNFDRAVVASLSTRTVVTVDPVGPEVDALRNYARTAPFQSSAILDQLICAIPNPASIQKVMSVQQVLDKINKISESRSSCPEDQQFTALLYAVITHLDLDGLSRVISTKCGRCKSLIDQSTNRCFNTECPNAAAMENSNYETSFDLRLTITDQTGSLINCRLSGNVAETVLCCTVNDFLEMTDDRKCTLKWKFLMERYAVRIMVLYLPSRNPLISVVSCDKPSATEVANNLPHY